MCHVIKDGRFLSKMEGKTTFSRRLTERDPHIIRQIYGTARNICTVKLSKVFKSQNEIIKI